MRSQYCGSMATWQRFGTVNALRREAKFVPARLTQGLDLR
jgi:hypothetical protein